MSSYKYEIQVLISLACVAYTSKFYKLFIALHEKKQKFF